MDNISEEFYSDNEQEFYSKFLSVFENIETKDAEIKVEGELEEFFNELAEMYFNSSLGEENSKYVDSFTFFIACGVIICRSGKYFINVEELSKKTEDYRKSCEDNGLCIKKGTI